MTIVDEIDQLYEQAVLVPASRSDQALADWAEAVAEGHELDRESARYVRRCLNVARKLAAFWSDDRNTTDQPDEWRSRVDIALGARAWRPQFDLAWHLLELSPDEQTFVRVSELFRFVNNEPFLDGVSYGEWIESSAC